MTSTKAEIRDSLKTRLANKPDALTDEMIDDFVEGAHIELENALGVSFATTAVPDAYAGVVEDIALVDAYSYTITSVIKKSVSIGGDINVNYSDIANSLRDISKRLEDGIEKQIDQLGRKREFAYTSV